MSCMFAGLGVYLFWLLLLSIYLVLVLILATSSLIRYYSGRETSIRLKSSLISASLSFWYTITVFALVMTSKFFMGEGGIFFDRADIRESLCGSSAPLTIAIFALVSLIPFNLRFGSMRVWWLLPLITVCSILVLLAIGIWSGVLIDLFYILF